MTADRHECGFKSHATLAEARERVLDAVVANGETEVVSIDEADGRVLAAAVTAERPVPHYDRAAMDGFALRAADTDGASDRAPARVGVSADGTVGPGTATRVHTGSELPAGADAVVMVEHVDRFGEELEVRDAVTPGENVAPVGADVEAGAQCFTVGHQLGPADLGLCTSVGVETVSVSERPTVAVLPTGEELVTADPEPGQVVETNGLTVSRYVERWGGRARYRDAVTDERDALREAIERDRDADLVVTTGGSSVGERDLVPDVVEDLGTVLDHGVAIKPGHPVAIGVVEETPILMLPGYPVSCIVTAVQLLRPAVKAAGNCPQQRLPSTEATLARKIASEPGTRQFVRVRLESDDEGSGTPGAIPVAASGAGVLSTVTAADGWVVVPESVEGLDAGRTVSVQGWEWSQ